MYRFGQFISRSLQVILMMALLADMVVSYQTTGTLRGQVADQLGAMVAGASVTVRGANGFERVVKTNDEGAFVFRELAPGSYTLHVSAKGFSPYENHEVKIVAGANSSLEVKLEVKIEDENLTVSTTGTSLSTDPDDNKGALVLQGRDLDVLPDDPDELTAVLQVLAGPTAGPNGGRIYIDNFTAAGSLPSRQAIREIRINQNPFSAENDVIGGRIDITTRNSATKLRGSGFFSFNERSLNSRNPYAQNKPPYRFFSYGGDLSGPTFSKKASFFASLNRREINDNAIINATILDSAFNSIPLSEAVLTPRRFWDFSTRLDYQLNPKNNLVVRYSYGRSRLENSGIGGFSLPSIGFDTSGNENVIQVSETSILSASIVNDTRFQYVRTRRDQAGDNTAPNIRVLEAFTGGGSLIGLSFDETDRMEFQNSTTWLTGRHTIKVGGRLRRVHINNASSSNFGGTFIFGGGEAPALDENNQVVLDENGLPVIVDITSLERYRRTLLFQQLNLTPSEIRSLGGGATLFSIAGGQPLASVTQWDFGGFLQDDWRLRPNFTLSMGLRYEVQTNIDNNLNFAPRLAFAWAPGQAGNRPPKTVIRGGAGIFYDRFNENFTLQTLRFNGINQRQFIVADQSVLDLFPQVPSVETLLAFANQSVWRVAGDLRSPYTIQTGFSVERQLPRNFTITTAYIYARGLHTFRARNINAPLPSTFDPTNPESGTRPFGDVGNIFEYESNGIFKRHQLVVNAMSRINRGFTLFSTYALSKANSDTDGPNGFPANTFDLASEFGRASGDTRHWAVIGGTIDAPWAIRLSPMVVAWSGAPFNITTGIDANGDTLFMERPAFATDLTKESVIITSFGAFDINPGPGDKIIPRNFGQGPGFFSMNLRAEKTFGFGGSDGARAAALPQNASRAPANAPPPRPAAPPAEKPYNLSFSVSVSNLLNNNNPGPRIGNLSSPLFGLSNSLSGGRVSVAGGNAAASNRRIELQARFRF